MRPVLFASLLIATLTGCLHKGGTNSDEPRASQQQCDYAGVHVKGLKVGAPLDDNQKTQWRQQAEYSTFMQKCVTYSSMSVQCLIDAPTVEVMQSCK